jgi:hypothetical protein
MDVLTIHSFDGSWFKQRSLHSRERELAEEVGL